MRYYNMMSHPDIGKAKMSEFFNTWIKWQIQDRSFVAIDFTSCKYNVD